jgi:putative membrane protein
MLEQYSRNQIATSIAILFHIIGLVGMLFFDTSLFAHSTYFHLLLMVGLLYFTHQGNTKNFLIFFIISFIVGVAVEMVGVNTGLLFGDYKYGSNLGPKILNVPIIIGANWMMIIYCCGTAVNMFFNKIAAKFDGEIILKRNRLHAFSLIIDGAFLAVFFDYILEPAAVKLEYWQWLGDEIPSLNYVCWFLTSVVLLTVFRWLKVYSNNLFAVHLLLIQILFFLIINAFL